MLWGLLQAEKKEPYFYNLALIITVVGCPYGRYELRLGNMREFKADC